MKVANVIDFDILLREHGKHVLCEVPMGINEKQVRQLIECAKEKNLFLVEGILLRHSPAYRYVQEQIHNGALGEIKSVDVDFGLEVSGFERLLWVNSLNVINFYLTFSLSLCFLLIWDRKKESAGGGVLEFAGFCLHVCLLAFQQEPKSLAATAVLNDEGVDIDTSVQLNYGDNKVGKFRINLMENRSNTATIVGAKGQVSVSKCAIACFTFCLRI